MGEKTGRWGQKSAGTTEYIAGNQTCSELTYAQTGVGEKTGRWGRVLSQGQVQGTSEPDLGRRCRGKQGTWFVQCLFQRVGSFMHVQKKKDSRQLFTNRHACATYANWHTKHYKAAQILKDSDTPNLRHIVTTIARTSRQTIYTSTPLSTLHQTWPLTSSPEFPEVLV